MRIAIVGTGISGLATAWMLRQRHDVHVFEASDRFGGHTNTVPVRVDGESHEIDTGFIVYNETTYPLFTRLLARLGVETKPTDMSFGVHCERSGLEWCSRGLSGVFAQRRNLLRPAFLRMLLDVVRFNRESHALLAADDEKVALGDYLLGAGYSRAFIDHYLVPMGAAIWSAEPNEMLRFPALAFVRFFRNHGLLDTSAQTQWRVVRGGSARYVDALVEPIRDRIRTRAAVQGVRREGDRVWLRANEGPWEPFDRVVLACHSDQAMAMLEPPTQTERKLLSAIRYQENDTILHTDTSVMPERRRAWASWNYRVPSDGRQSLFVTYDMNRLQGIDSEHSFLVSLNAGERIDPRRILARFTYHHPVFDADAMTAQRLRDHIDGGGGVHFCGAYWGYGFHEDGLSSAVRVARKLGGDL